MSASDNDGEPGRWSDGEFERRRSSYVPSPKMGDYRTQDYRKAHELFAAGDLPKRVNNARGAEEREEIIESMLWVAWGYNQDPLRGPFALYRKSQESKKELVREREELCRKKEALKQQQRELRECIQFLEDTVNGNNLQINEDQRVQKLQSSSRTKAIAASPTTTQDENQNCSVESPEEELGDQHPKMCLKRPAKDITAELQGTKKARVSGQCSSQSNAPSQFEEPQPSDNCSVQQSICALIS